MGYTREERLDIGRKIYHNELSKREAAGQYGISLDSARDYMRLYRDVHNLPPKNRMQAAGKDMETVIGLNVPDLSEYESMSKEELIHELVKSRIKDAGLSKESKCSESFRAEIKYK